MKTTVINVHKEPCDVSIMRPSIYGNPFVIGRDGTRGVVVARFRDYFYERIHDDTIFCQAIGELRGKKLGCCCDQDEECHGDVYVEYLNRED